MVTYEPNSKTKSLGFQFNAMNAGFNVMEVHL